MVYCQDQCHGIVLLSIYIPVQFAKNYLLIITFLAKL
uniref:Uncharacterized protein n=1 Tax=Lepeophtheirus salmonis TaxID=72036 RepID=A0A0K2UW92_LEPSM